MVKIKVAIISDIHGNIVALKEIVKDAKKNNVEEYLILGDLVNDLPFGNETIDYIKKLTNKVLKGNKEQYFIEYDEERYEWDNIQFKSMRFLFNELSKENLEYIKTLPHFMNVEYDGVKLFFAHGSPESVSELIHEYDVTLMEKYTKDLKADALIFGHTHEKTWYKYVNNKLVLNVGCAGVSPNYFAKAEYVILDISNGKINKIDHRLVDYDPEIVKEKIIESGVLENEKVLTNLAYCSITGNGIVKEEFFKEAKLQMIKRTGKWYKDDAKGIFRYFKLIDDDVWLGLAEKYSEYFLL